MSAHRRAIVEGLDEIEEERWYGPICDDDYDDIFRIEVTEAERDAFFAEAGYRREGDRLTARAIA